MFDHYIEPQKKRWYVLKRDEDYKIKMGFEGYDPLYGEGSWDIHAGPFNSVEEAETHIPKAVFDLGVKIVGHVDTGGDLVEVDLFETSIDRRLMSYILRALPEDMDLPLQHTIRAENVISDLTYALVRLSADPEDYLPGPIPLDAHKAKVRDYLTCIYLLANILRACKRYPRGLIEMVALEEKELFNGIE